MFQKGLAHKCNSISLFDNVKINLFRTDKYKKKETKKFKFESGNK